MCARPRGRKSGTRERAGQESPAPSIVSTETKRNGKFLLVGIGASAGGVTALERFFEHVPYGKNGIAYVVVMHLSPEYESNLAPLIQSHTGLKVTQVTRRVKVVPDNVYVIPPGKQLSMSDGYINVSALDIERGRRVPIDLFFRTLADSHGEWSAAVVLSGTGSDGALGVTRIKEVGGITLAQEPTEAEHDQMPKSAIATGFIDYVLPLSRMGEQLVLYRDNLIRIELPQPQAEAEEAIGVAQEAQVASATQADSLYKILALLRARTGHNFTSYKRSTLLRRIERRMQVNDVHSLTDYLTFMRSNPAE